VNSHPQPLHLLPYRSVTQLLPAPHTPASQQIISPTLPVEQPQEQEAGRPSLASWVNQWALGIVVAVQNYALLVWKAVYDLFSKPRYWDDIIVQMDQIGFGSAPIVLLSGFFTGCVLALQSVNALQEFGAVSMTQSSSRSQCSRSWVRSSQD
jgi:hypothetical protein